MDPDTLDQVQQLGRTWADVAIEVWRDVRAEVLAAAAGFLAGWLGLQRPRLNKFTRKEDKPRTGIRAGLPPRARRGNSVGLFSGDDQAEADHADDKPLV